MIKGCSQKRDYEETYVPMAKLTTLRILLSVTVERNLETRHMDVKNAFLHGEFQEKIYMKIRIKEFESKNQSTVSKKKISLWSQAGSKSME